MLTLQLSSCVGYMVYFKSEKALVNYPFLKINESIIFHSGMDSYSDFLLYIIGLLKPNARRQVFIADNLDKLLLAYSI